MVKCSQCSFTSSSEYDLVFHWRLQHDAQKDKFKMTAVAPPMADMSVKADKGRVFECIMCEFTTSAKENLSEHIIKEHKEMLEEMGVQKNDENVESLLDSDDEKVAYYKCNMCDYASVWMSHFSEHTKQSHQIFKCGKCIFTSSSELATGHHWRLKHQNEKGSEVQNHINYSADDTSKDDTTEKSLQ